MENRSLITVSFSENSKLYHRQYQYLLRHPDCTELPDWVIDPNRTQSHAERATGYRKKAHSIFTVKSKENPKLYQRQYYYVKRNPDCKELPAHLLSLDGARQRGLKGQTTLKRMTTTYSDDPMLYRRQQQYIQRHPECKELPQWLKIGETKPVLGRPVFQKDSRLTITHAENRLEYYRQYNYIRRNPECESVPPRRPKKT